MLADEARHPPRVPERVPREERWSITAAYACVHDRAGHVPALPAGRAAR